MPEPEEWALDCAAGALRAGAQLAEEIAATQRALESTTLLPATRARLTLVAETRGKYRRHLSELLEPVLALTPPTADTSVLAYRPGAIPTEKYYENLLRDWVWGERENQSALRRVREILPEGFKAGSMAIAGAGGCRLAMDMHRELKPERTYAIDLHPTLFLAASRVLQGQRLELYEFPAFPSGKAALSHIAKGPSETGAGDFVQVFADALRPPFRPEGLDTLVTPWFVDILSDDFRVVAPRLNHFLKTGGHWILVGPLAFGNRPLSQLYGLEEATQIAKESGFDVLASNYESMEYLRSPHSAQERSDKILCLVARKSAPAGPWASLDNRPEWLRDTHLPVPLTSDIEETRRMAQHNLEILSLVDGKASIRRMATQLAKNHNLDVEKVEVQLGAVLSSLARLRR